MMPKALYFFVPTLVTFGWATRNVLFLLRVCSLSSPFFPFVWILLVAKIRKLTKIVLSKMGHSTGF